MKFEIRNRWTGAVQYSCELSAEMAGKSYGLQLGFVVKSAIASGSNLRGSNLRGSYLRDSNLLGSDLSGSDLRDSNLSGSDLRGSDLRGSNLRGSYLRDSNLRGSDLRGSDLRGSDLRGSNLRGSDLRGSDLRGSNLSGSYLLGSNLSGSNLSGSNLRSIRADFYDVLSWAPAEVPALIDALRSGSVDGSTYTGTCACLVGTLANARGIEYQSLEHDSGRPIEVFFAAIRTGDTPETNQVSAIALGWAESWLANMREAFVPKAA